MHIKSYGHIEKASKLQEGEVEFVVSTNAWDSHGERIDVNGINLKDYMKNPIVLWGHDGFNLPIAKTTKIWKEGNKLIARAKFYLKDEFPAKVYQYIVDGMLNAASIGGIIDEWGEDGMTISKMTMKEFSVVPIPANQEALVTAKSMDNEQQSEFNGLAKAYARKLFTDGNDSDLVANINVLKTLVAALEELVVQSTDEPKEDKAINRRVVLRSAQAVDTQAEKIIRSIKVVRKITS